MIRSVPVARLTIRRSPHGIVGDRAVRSVAELADVSRALAGAFTLTTTGRLVLSQRQGRSPVE